MKLCEFCGATGCVVLVGAAPAGEGREQRRARCPDCGGKGETPAWHRGRKVGRTLYRDDVLVGLVDTPELAAAIVAAMNAKVSP